jgi:hypothetical protein
MRFHRLILACIVAGALCAPATFASAQPATDARGVGIRLTEVPTDRRNDPRAQSYIVDHVAPGARFSRTIEVSNNTDEALTLQLYAAAATVESGKFTVGDGRAANPLTSWMTIDPPQVTLASGRSAPATVSFAVDPQAESGEYYAAALVERPPSGDGPVGLVARVGVRVYLSVGAGGEPEPDFRIDSLTASRTADGVPIVEAEVVNTGGRALDLSGELKLSDGPGGVGAGPVPAELGTTLGPGDVAPVRVMLDPALPAGPWLAEMTVRGSGLERRAEARIRFPEPGESNPPVAADSASGLENLWPFLVLALLLLLLVGGILLFFLIRRRRRREASE